MVGKRLHNILPLISEFFIRENYFRICSNKPDIYIVDIIGEYMYFLADGSQVF